jgi:hypothetical protein
MTKRLPPFELQGSRISFTSLLDEIASFSVSPTEQATMPVWLKTRSGDVLYMGVESRDLLPRFEVFTLSLASLDELKAKIRHWQPPEGLEGIPEPMRTIMTTCPKVPKPPEVYQDWPFETWRTQVLRRAEFIVEDVSVDGAVGENPNMQSGARPQSVPSAASASSEVTVGILFSGDDGQRLLFGVDWMPFNMVIADDEATIDAYLELCDTEDMRDHLDRRFGSD